MKLVWWGGELVPGTRCEDAPCCGCCGPGSDDPAYQESDEPFEPVGAEDYDGPYDDGFDGEPMDNYDDDGPDGDNGE